MTLNTDQIPRCRPWLRYRLFLSASRATGIAIAGRRSIGGTALPIVVIGAAIGVRVVVRAIAIKGSGGY